MTFKITRTSDWEYSEYKEISTIEELIEFYKTFEIGNCSSRELILTDYDTSHDRSNDEPKYEYCLEIYDEYRE